MKIAVYGSASGDIGPEVREKARQIGREIATRGHDLITGACPGLPYEAVCGAREVSERTGKIIGFSPGFCKGSHEEWYGFPTRGFDAIRWLSQTSTLYIDNDKLRKSMRLKLRNIYSVAASDAGVIICGRTGSLNELTLLYDMGRLIGLLEGTGGVPNVFTKSPEFRDLLTKETGADIVVHSEPKDLVEAIITKYEARTA